MLADHRLHLDEVLQHIWSGCLDVAIVLKLETENRKATAGGDPEGTCFSAWRSAGN